MGMIEEVESTLKKAFENSVVSVTDLVGDQNHLEVFVASEKFEGLMMLKQHRLVMDALADLLKERLHAVQLKTKTLKKYNDEIGENNE